MNKQAIALEEAEAEIRLTVKTSYLSKTPKNIIDDKIRQIIRTAAKQIKIPALREVGIKSLILFYNRQWRIIQALGDATTLLLIAELSEKSRPQHEQIKTLEKIQARGGFADYESKAKAYGVPLQEYSERYMKERVEPVMKRLAESQPTDPEDTRRISIRARAELEVRYQSHIDEINNLRDSGIKLVIASTHADCSERCAPYQGRVYSLDGTSGTTDDGRKYVPLEVATDIYYTTKAGRTYKNGMISGFNCRHYLIPYKSGYVFPKPNKAEEQREYAITQRQRQLERNVLKWKTRALEAIKKSDYNEARQKARFWNGVYIKYSQENNRAYYPSRTKILNR